MAMARINLEESFRVPLELLGKVPVVLVPLAIFSLVSLLPTLILRRGFTLGWEALVATLVSGFLTLLGMSWVTLLFKQHFEEKAVHLGETWTELSRGLGNIAVAVILVTVITTVGFFPYIVPGIILEAMFLIVIPQVAAEKTTFDKSITFMSRFVFAEKNFAFLLLYVLIAFALALIPVIGSFLSAFFIILFFPYLYLRYGRE